MSEQRALSTDRVECPDCKGTGLARRVAMMHGMPHTFGKTACLNCRGLGWFLAGRDALTNDTGEKV